MLYTEAGNLIYLGMVEHKTVLDSIRVMIQSGQRKPWLENERRK
jgi:hypothetical protein